MQRHQADDGGWAFSPSTTCDSRSGARGSVALDLTLALLPVLALVVWAWHLLELRAGEVIVQRAAGAAARAAAVVLPDDPTFYGGEPVGRFGGARREQVELAAARVLASSTRFHLPPRVELSMVSAGGTLTARVSVRFDAGLGARWLGAGRTLAASAAAPYAGAGYVY